jgi:hypothetical protein
MARELISSIHGLDPTGRLRLSRFALLQNGGRPCGPPPVRYKNPLL